MRRQGLPRNSHPWFRGSLWEGQAPTSPAPPDPAQGERPGGRTSSSTAQWSRQRRSRQTLLDAKLGVGTVEVSVRRSYLRVQTHYQQREGLKQQIFILFQL